MALPRLGFDVAEEVKTVQAWQRIGMKMSDSTTQLLMSMFITLGNAYLEIEEKAWIYDDLNDDN